MEPNRTGLWQPCARFSRSNWQGVVGTGRLRTARIAFSRLLDPICLAALNTGIPFLRPLPVILTLTLNVTRLLRRCLTGAASRACPPAPTLTFDRERLHKGFLMEP
eukprot:366188-Chlamydomonas_euryale.AAC.8